MVINMYIAIIFILILAILCLLLFHVRKKKIIRKIYCIPCRCKCHLLNELTRPLGYCYNQKQDIFTNTADAWQKSYGYASIYDRMAPFLGMIFDCKPIYFDYEGKTWRIEFWKGQYGINTGAEAGVYHADTIIPSSARDLTIFHAATEEEAPEINMELFYKGKPVAEISGTKWWLTIFSMGQFSNPEDLSLDISLRFTDFEMRNAFIDALYTAGYNIDSLHLCIYFTDVTFTFPASCKRKSFFKNPYRCYVQWKNRLFCKLYCFVTRPFNCTRDKLLYLYYLMPFIFRRMLRLKRLYRSQKPSCKK